MKYLVCHAEPVEKKGLGVRYTVVAEFDTLTMAILDMQTRQEKQPHEVFTVLQEAV